MISTRLHAILDYVLGILLIFLPWVLGFSAGGVETWTPVMLGGAMILYSLSTDYELAVIRLIPFPTHLILDGIAGGFLALAPWLLGFAAIAWSPHLVAGLLVLVLALFSDRVPARPSSPGH